MLEQITMMEYLSDLGLWSSKTCQGFSQATAEKTFEESSKKSQESPIREPMFLDLTGGIGAPLVSLWETDIRFRGEYTTRNFGEKPSETAIREICSRWGLHSVAEDSRLSLILEEQPHPKYFLSARACEGILKRANKKGRTLPVKLENALLRQTGKAGIVQQTETPSVFTAAARYQYKEDTKIEALAANDRHLRADTPLIFAKSDFGTYKEDTATLRASGGDYGGGSEMLIIQKNEDTTIRRLTPKECERLQGFPDDWTLIGEWIDSKGKKHKGADAPRYKALGNSICLPFWDWLLGRISDQYEDTTPTLGSLFDGIGGFPLCWEERNGKGSAVWASEIEEFPIAVTKYHFPEPEPRDGRKGRIIAPRHYYNMITNGEKPL